MHRFFCLCYLVFFHVPLEVVERGATVATLDAVKLYPPLLAPGHVLQQVGRVLVEVFALRMKAVEEARHLHRVQLDVIFETKQGFQLLAAMLALVRRVVVLGIVLQCVRF
jgi:hypothetical protein